MKTAIIGLLLLPVLLAGAPASATTCICIGVANTKLCGAGGAGGSFLKVHKNVSASIFDFCLMTPASRAEFNSTGQAYDTSTGWFCFK